MKSSWVGVCGTDPGRICVYAIDGNDFTAIGGKVRSVGLGEGGWWFLRGWQILSGASTNIKSLSLNPLFLLAHSQHKTPQSIKLWGDAVRG